MRDQFECLRVDLRGHGRSPAVAPDMDLTALADDVNDTLTAVEFAPSAVVGFSLGGMIAQTLALVHPQAVSALVLGACPATLSDEARQTMIDRGAAAERGGMAVVVDSTLRRWFTTPFLESGGADDVRRRLLGDDVRAWAMGWRAIARLDTHARLREIAVPTLCVAGEEDVSAPPAAVAAVAAAIAGAQFVVLPGAPHMLFIEQPRETAAAIASFLRR